MAPGTGISVAHISGTAWKPSLRAASAGNSAVRSGVTVNSTLITSSGARSLRLITAVTRSAVHSRMASLSSASTWMAPRMALTVTCSTPYDLTSRLQCSPCSPPRARGRWLQADGGVEFADLLGGEVSGAAGGEVPELDRPDRHPHQAADRMADLDQHPADDPIAPLVQRDLDQGAPAGLLKHPELVR